MSARCFYLMLCLLLGITTGEPFSAAAQEQPQRADSVLVRFVDADLRMVTQALGAFLPKPVLASGVPPDRVTLDYPHPVARSSIPQLLAGLLAPHGLQLVEEEAFFRVAGAPTRQSPAGPAATAPALELFVLRLKHAVAADVAATINLLFGGGGTYSGRPGLSPTLTESLRSIPPAESAPRESAPAARQSAELSGPATIVPDDITNALLVRASAADYAIIEAAVRQLDIRPLQVMLEVLIVEARRDDGFELGAALTASKTVGARTTEVELTGAGAGDLVLKILRMGSTEVAAALALAEHRGQIQIQSRPVLLVANNVEARLLVGSQQPFVQVSRALPTDNAARDQVVQYRDVGTKLTVRPTINADGYVSLIIQQEISAATEETQFNAPVISTREARTQLLVRDGQTVVLGGLTDEQTLRVSSGIPVISRIPVLGGLFGRTSRRTSTVELFLFLTPTILRSDEDAAAVTAPRLPGA